VLFPLSCADLTAFWSPVTVCCAPWMAFWSDEVAEVSLATFVLSVATAASAALHALEVAGPGLDAPVVPLPAHADASAASSLFSWFCAEVRGPLNQVNLGLSPG